MSDDVAIALNELRHLTTCRCDSAWTERNLHRSDCAAEYRADVETLAAALHAPTSPSAAEHGAAGTPGHADGTESAQDDSRRNGDPL